MFELFLLDGSSAYQELTLKKTKQIGPVELQI